MGAYSGKIAEIASSVAGSIYTRRDTAQAAVGLDKVSQFIGVETLVPDQDHGLGQKWQELFGYCCLSAPTGNEEKSHDVSTFINGRSELRVMPTFTESNGLILKFSDGILTGLLDLDDGAVDNAKLAFWFSSQGSKNFG